MIPARIVGILLMLLPTLALAEGEADLCNAAAINAANNGAMPPDVLLALTLVETGRSRNGTFLPWPWTVNMEGKGYWFDTRTEAVAFVTQSYATGARSFDIGCFQINHRWHGEAFTSFNQMFDPLDNATYAAKFMTSLFKEGGSWSWAAGAYHSRTVNLAAKYRARFDRIIAKLPTSSTNVELPIVLASNRTALHTRLSTWSPFQPIDQPETSIVNGSLAGGLLSNSSTPLLTASRGALY
ncbi:MAG: transglycosylase SLT domain-containing protein [Alphaproteobacteria bacterium]